MSGAVPMHSLSLMWLQHLPVSCHAKIHRWTTNGASQLTIGGEILLKRIAALTSMAADPAGNLVAKRVSSHAMWKWIPLPRHHTQILSQTPSNTAIY